MGNIVILDRTPTLHRIKDITTRMNMSLIETSSCTQVMTRIKGSPNDIDLVIIDILADEENCFKLISDIKYELPDLPVIILTSLNTRKDFVHGLRAGANDYILKPFDDNIIEDRITRLTHQRVANAEFKRSDTIDMRRYLDTEIIKSRKGKYALTVGMIGFFTPSDPNGSNLRREYDILTERLFRALRSVFFDTDICIPYGNHTVMAIMPFCGKENIHLIERKVRTQGLVAMDDLRMKDGDVACAFVTIPDECDNTDDMFILLNERLMQLISFQKSDEPKVSMAKDFLILEPIDPLLR